MNMLDVTPFQHLSIMKDDFPLFRNDGNGIDGGQLDKMGLEAPACFWFRLRSKFSNPQLMTATSLH